MLSLIEREIARRVRGRLEDNRRLDEVVDRILERQSDPYSAAETMLADFADIRGETDE